MCKWFIPDEERQVDRQALIAIQTEAAFIMQLQALYGSNARVRVVPHSRSLLPPH